jgi:hypothetical protein
MRPARQHHRVDTEMDFASALVVSTLVMVFVILVLAGIVVLAL